MKFNAWFAQLRKQLDLVMDGNASEASFLNIVEELARFPDLVVGKPHDMNLDMILCLILAGALSTGEIDQVSKLLAEDCSGEGNPLNLEIISAVARRDDLGPRFI